MSCLGGYYYIPYDCELFMALIMFAKLLVLTNEIFTNYEV